MIDGRTVRTPVSSIVALCDPSLPPWVRATIVLESPVNVPIEQAHPDARRANLHISGNRTDHNAGTPHGAIVRVLGYDDVVVVDNVQPMSWNRDMYMVELRDSCRVAIHGNELGPYAAGQFFIASGDPC